MKKDVYKYLVDNNLLDEFLKNFSVTRKIREMNKVRFPGEAFYYDGRDKVYLEVYRYQYKVENIYNIFGCEFITSEIVCGQSVNEDDIPFKKKGNYKTDFCNLSGYEHSTYLPDGKKNVMSKYGKSGVFDLPSNFSLLFKDRDFGLFIHLFYLYIGDKNNIDMNDVYSIKRLVEISNEMSKLKKERDEIIESLGSEYILIKG